MSRLPHFALLSSVLFTAGCFDFGIKPPAEEKKPAPC